jgi:NADPH-dependent curcumin reductase CurA
MSQSTTWNRRIVLNARPRGAPTAADLRTTSDPVPSPAEGQVLLRTLYLPLDLYMRGRVSDWPSYAAPVGYRRRDGRRHCAAPRGIAQP